MKGFLFLGSHMRRELPTSASETNVRMNFEDRDILMIFSESAEKLGGALTPP